MSSTPLRDLALGTALPDDGNTEGTTQTVAIIDRSDMVFVADGMRLASAILDSLIMAPIGLGHADVLARRNERDREQLRRLATRPEVRIFPARSPRPIRTKKKHKLKGLRP